MTAVDTAQPPRRRILVVEDEIELSGLLKAILTDEAYAVEQAYSVSDALHLLDEDTFDAAVLDVELRDGMVFAVADALKARRIPYMFLSAVYKGVVPAVHGRVRFVSKPYQLEELKHHVGQMLDGRP